MRGTLRKKRDGHAGGPAYWELRVSAVDPASGRSKQISRGFRGTREEADKALTRLAGKVHAGRTASKSTTFGIHLERWYEVTAPRLSPTTAYGWRLNMDRHIKPALGARRLDRLTTIDLDTFYASLERPNPARKKAKEGLSPSSVRQVHTIIRLALRQAVRWGLLDTNPASDVTLPAQASSSIKPPDPDEVRRLITTAEDQEDVDLATFIFVAATTGARRAELCALRWSGVDLDDGSMEIAQTVTAAGGRKIFKDTKTHAARRVSLDGGIVLVLRVHRARMEQRAHDGLYELTPSAYVFSPALDGATPWHPDKVTAAFGRLRDKAGVQCRLHDLRHFSATRLLGKGVDVRTVAGRLGHANASTTLTVYAHFLAAADRDAARIIGEVLAGPAEDEDEPPGG